MNSKVQALLSKEIHIPQEWSYCVLYAQFFDGRTLSLRQLLQNFVEGEKFKLKVDIADDLVENQRTSTELLEGVVTPGMVEISQLLGNAAKVVDLENAATEDGRSGEQTIAALHDIILTKSGEFIYLQQKKKMSENLITAVEELFRIAEEPRSVTTNIKLQKAFSSIMIFLNENLDKAKFDVDVARSMDKADFPDELREVMDAGEELAKAAESAATWNNIMEQFEEFAYENNIHPNQVGWLKS